MAIVKICGLLYLRNFWPSLGNHSFWYSDAILDTAFRSTKLLQTWKKFLEEMTSS